MMLKSPHSPQRKKVFKITKVPKSLQSAQNTSPFRVEACPRSNTIETEKAIFQLLLLAVIMELISLELVWRSLNSRTQ